MAQEKLGAIESIRGIACLMVLLSHLSLTFYPQLHNFDNISFQNQPFQAFIHHSPLGFFFSGTAAVFIFFVLSGYILTYVVFKARHVPKQILSMSIKRYPRLMLPAVVSCICAWGVIINWRADTSMLSHWISEYGISGLHYSLNDAIYTGAIAAFTVTGINPYNPVLWTMKVELIGSLIIFAHTFAWFRLPPARFVLDLTAAMGCLLLISSHVLLPQLSYGLCSFYMGYFSYQYGRTMSGYLAVPLLVVGLYLAGFHSNSRAYDKVSELLGSQGYITCHCLAGLLIVYSVLFYPPLRQRIANKVMMFLGQVSFSAYLLHMLLIITFSAHLFNYLYMAGISYDASALISMLLSLAVIYLVSWIFHHIVDRPSMALSQTLVYLFIKPCKPRWKFLK